ncbi:transposase [Streptomyces sp. NPDC008061]|uniref:transposase n=1 Tax=Streptomyces sp. NPDC008061 TaxID=3364805 RepID=UPI0036E69154
MLRSTSRCPASQRSWGARVLAEFGDDPTRYTSAKARKNYAGTSPITRASGKSHTVQSRYIRNNRLADALQRQVFAALRASPGARRYYENNVPAKRATTPHSASSATASSASSTAVSKPVPATTKRPPGHTMPSPLPLDLQRHGVSEQRDPPPHRGRRDFRRPRGRDPPRTLRETRPIVPFAIPSAMGLSQAFP